MPMLAAHATVQGLLGRIRRICVVRIDALKESLALIAADKILPLPNTNRRLREMCILCASASTCLKSVLCSEIAVLTCSMWLYHSFGETV